MTEPMRVDDLIVQNLVNAQEVVMDALNLESKEELSGWSSVLASMRGLPDQSMSMLGKPLIQKIFGAFGKDPAVRQDREDMKVHQDIIALCLQDCLHLIMQNMQAQQHNANQLKRGNAGGLVL